MPNARQTVITAKDTSTYLKLVSLVSTLKLRHFTATEIYNTLGKNHRPHYIPADLIKNLTFPLLIWDQIREDTGIKIRLTSSYRDPEHNREVKGKKDSLHLRAAAIDGQPWHYRKTSMRKIELWLQTTNILMYKDGWIVTKKSLGVGFYKTFAHVDDRGRHGRWSPVTWRG